MSAAEYRINKTSLERLVSQLFQAEGIPLRDALQVAKVLTMADCCGIQSHGVRQVRSYLTQIQQGSINARPVLRIIKETAATALLDGGNGLGPVVGAWAMKVCLKKAQAAGVASVAVRQSNHFGIAGYYARMALKHNMIGMAMTNAPARVVPTHGSVAAIGTNPIAIAIPAGQQLPFILDMATSVRALNHIEVLGQLGKKLPAGWAVDKYGRTITDPHRAIQEGLLLPLGGEETTSGYKGYSLGVMVDLLCGPLSGALFGRYITTRANQVAGQPRNIGHLFVAWHVEAFCSLHEFTTSVDQLILDLKNIPTRNGEDHIWVAGEKELKQEQEAEREGVSLPHEVWADLQKLASEKGLNFK